MEGRNVTIDINCRRCRKNTELKLSRHGIRLREDGALIQDAFPYLDNGERELMISGTCNACWFDMFGICGKEGCDGETCKGRHDVKSDT